MEIGHDEAQPAGRGGGIERARLQHRADAGKGVAEGWPQLLGAGGERVAARSLDEQRVGEQAAQPPERAARRRLANPEPLRRTGDVPLLEQGVEHHEEVQIDPA